MGNQSSNLLRRSRRPSLEDYKAYADDLTELQKFLNEKFAAGHPRSCVVDNEFDAEYLDVLKIKLRQLQNVRRLVRSRRGRDVPPTLTRLLDALEPQCQRAVDELTRLRHDSRSSVPQVPSVVSTASEPDDADPCVDQPVLGSASQTESPAANQTSVSVGKTPQSMHPCGSIA